MCLGEPAKRKKLINVDPCMCALVDCRMLKKDYPSYACEAHSLAKNA